MHESAIAQLTSLTAATYHDRAIMASGGLLFVLLFRLPTPTLAARTGDRDPGHLAHIDVRRQDRPDGTLHASTGMPPEQHG
jgi:hypothetical protein